MTFIVKLATAVALAASLGAAPVAADPGGGKGGHARHDDRSSRGGVHHVADCPPGLAKKNPPCIPPGQARKGDVHYGTRIGDVLRVGDYLVIRDPRRYDLATRPGWSYYRDGDRVYRVDSGTRRILAVLNLIDAFTN